MTPERRRAIAALIVWSPVLQAEALIDCLAEIDRLAGEVARYRALVDEDADASGLLHELDAARASLENAWHDRDALQMRAEEAERQVAEAREENERLRHGLDEEGLSLAERCCGSIKDHLAKRAEEAERQLAVERANIDTLGESIEVVCRQRDTLRAVVQRVPKLLDAVDGIQTTVVVQEHDRFFIRESADAWNVLHAIDGNQSDVEEAIEKLDAAWPTWREGAGEP